MSLELDIRTNGGATVADRDSEDAVEPVSGRIAEARSIGLADRVQMLSGDYSLEVLPGLADKVVADKNALRPGMALYVPYIPGSDYALVSKAVERLAAAGFQPVPHLSARSLKSRDDLKDRLNRLFDAGARDLLLIAGDQDRPDGPFSNTLEVLETGFLLDIGFRRMGVAGHPEGHPRARAVDLSQALKQKEAYAASTGTEMRLVSQFVLGAAPIIDWYRSLRAGGHSLPVRIGLPGPVAPNTLLKFAIQCGIGNSARFLARKPGFLRTVTRPWTPDEILVALAEAFPGDVGTPALGIHVFAFGGAERSLRWFNAVAHGGFSLNSAGRGFAVTV